MISEFAQEFWDERARMTGGSIRWTDGAMLEIDLALLASVLPERATLLDLGCGTGDLFLGVLDRLDAVVAVDFIADFLDRIPDDDRITKVVSPINEFTPDRTFDAAVMFGVVTHLTADDELAAYRTLRAAVPNGVVVVKNQCGRDGDVEVDGWSEAFARRYVARYPHVDAQASRLGEFFSEVDVVRYPDDVNRWSNSQHVAFVCRQA